MGFRSRLQQAAQALMGSALPQSAPAASSQASPRRWSFTRGTTTRGIAQGLTPARVLSALKEADQGNPAAFAELCQEIEDRDLHILGVLNTRRRAVANLSWHLEPASPSAYDREVAAQCTQILKGAPGLGRANYWLLDAIYKGYAAVEIEWKHQGARVVPARFHYRPQQWLRPDPDDPTMWRVVDEKDPAYGVPLWPNKWIVHTSQAKSGWPVQAGLGRPLCWWYLFKNYALKDWVSYSEKFGSPFRVGKYPSTAEDTDIDELEEALDQLGVDAYACIPDDMSVEFIADAGGKTGGSTQEPLLQYCDRAISKGVLGQTLTTEDGQNGARALGVVHNDVRADIRDSDARDLEESLTDGLIAPLVMFNWGAAAGRPRFVLETEPPADKKAEADAQAARGAVFKIARELGLGISVAQVRDELGIREVQDGEAVLAPISPAPFSRRHDHAAACHPLISAAAGQAETPVGQMEAVMAAARRAVTAAWQAIIAQLRAELGADAKVEVSTLRARIPAVLAEIDLDPYADGVATGTLTAEALGRAQVREGDPAKIKLPTTSPLSDVAGWAALAGLSPSEWGARIATHRAQALDAVRYAVLRVIQDVLNGLDDDIAPSDSLSRAATDPKRTDGVVDTGVTSTWSQGRLDEARQQQATTGRRLYLRYHTMEDSRVRPTHAAMNERVYPIDHPIWLIWKPPNGFGCRCWVTVHTAEEVKAAGWTITEDFPQVDGDPARPDQGFDTDFTDPAYDWSAFPGSWKKAVGAGATGATP